jgi:hypothetical protein
MRVEVFLSYARKDSALAKQVIEALDKAEMSVWWDQKIRPDAERFSSEIESAILGAQCFLVLWSPDSTKSGWVLEECEVADEDKSAPPKFVQARIDQTRIPMGYRQRQCTELSLDEEGKIAENSLEGLVCAVKSAIGIKGKKEHIIKSELTGAGWEIGDLAIETPVPGMDTFLSFRPCGEDGVFLLMRLDTTDGWVESTIRSAGERHAPFKSKNEQYVVDGEKTYLKVRNDIFFIMDPIRPYGIQIGRLRSERPSANPGTISGDIPLDQVKALQTKLEWVSMTLAELLSSQEGLRYLWNEIGSYGDSWSAESIRKVRQLIAKNPNAPLELQRTMCPFCQPEFKEARRLSSPKKEAVHGTYIIANDFPFGPAFHYLAITQEPVHSWENLTYPQIRGLNLMIHDFLSDDANRKGAAGISFGFNSTVRHLILGSHTRSSAGASIPHIHKQAWGMAPRTPNLAEQLIEVSQAYWNHNVDYQGNYIKALRKAEYVIWEDDYVALYVPYGQCSKFELQAMVKEPRGCLTDLTEEEVVSLSKAEYIALKLFKSLNINSFNHVTISKLYRDNRAPTFRLVEAFITREVDWAVSELSMLFVVDQHPRDSRNEIWDQWVEMERAVTADLD